MYIVCVCKKGGFASAGDIAISTGGRCPPCSQEARHSFWPIEARTWRHSLHGRRASGLTMDAIKLFGLVVPPPTVTTAFAQHHHLFGVRNSSERWMVGARWPCQKISYCNTKGQNIPYREDTERNRGQYCTYRLYSIL